MRIILIALTTALLVVAYPSHGAGYAEPSAGSIGIEIEFSEDEIRVIRAYYQSHGGNGNGKHKHKDKGLPPGIAKNLQRGKPLPPGIAKQALPGDLDRALPPTGDRYERVIVAGKILLVEIATQVVHDVLTDIVFD